MCVSPSRSPEQSTGSKAERTCILEFRSFSGFGKLQGSGTAGASPHLRLVLLATGAKQGLPLVLRLGVTCSQALACSSLLPHSPKHYTNEAPRVTMGAAMLAEQQLYQQRRPRTQTGEAEPGRKGAMTERRADSSPRQAQAPPPPALVPPPGPPHPGLAHCAVFPDLIKFIFTGSFNCGRNGGDAKR